MQPNSDRQESVERYGDVPVAVDVRLGRKSVSIRRLAELAPGSILRMNRAVGERLEIFANGMLLGHGEVIVAGEAVRVRIAKWGGPR